MKAGRRRQHSWFRRRSDTFTESSGSRRQLINGLAPFVVPILVIATWEIAARLGGGNDILLPPPSQVFVALIELIRTGTLFDDITASMMRVAAGYALAVIVAVPIGLVMGYSVVFDRLLTTTVDGLRPIPASAWIPISIILMGIGDRPAIFLVFIGTVWSVILNTSHGVKNVPKHLVWAAQTMGASQGAIFMKVIFPASLPAIFTGLRIAVGIAFTNVIVAELIAVRSGLGYLITEARMLVRTDRVIAGMVAIGAVGFALDVLVRFVMKRMLRWQKGLVTE
ncbi:MAG TPA: ABC transporter permease [Alphaproteobacteria bacterium]|nr:ABC transporter permease [Alphaproteobacteria bacterium]